VCANFTLCWVAALDWVLSKVPVSVEKLGLQWLALIQVWRKKNQGSKAHLLCHIFSAGAPDLTAL
jgi:hypothetical protein